MRETGICYVACACTSSTVRAESQARERKQQTRTNEQTAWCVLPRLSKRNRGEGPNGKRAQEKGGERTREANETKEKKNVHVIEKGCLWMGLLLSIALLGSLCLFVLCLCLSSRLSLALRTSTFFVLLSIVAGEVQCSLSMINLCVHIMLASVLDEPVCDGGLSQINGLGQWHKPSFRVQHRCIRQHALLYCL